MGKQRASATTEYTNDGSTGSPLAHLRIALLATVLAIASACILIFTALGVFSYREASVHLLVVAVMAVKAANAPLGSAVMRRIVI